VTQDSVRTVSGIPPLPALAPLIAGANYAASAGLQTSNSIGLRWDAYKSTAIKFQLDRISPSDSGGIFKNAQPGFTGPVTVTSVVVDFVFNVETTMNKYIFYCAFLSAGLGVMSSCNAELVVVVNAKNPVASMTAEQITQIFLGKSTSLTPFDQTESSPIRNEFYKKVADKESSQVKAIWSKLIFTGKGTPPKEFTSSADVKKAVANDVNSIAYIEKSAVDVSVKVVASFP